MNKIYYINAGFYIEGVSIVPDNAVEISEIEYNQYAGIAWPKGKVLGSDSFGSPVWLDAPPLTHEEEVAAADAQKQQLIDQANVYMNSKQWPGKAALGRLKGDELAQYNAWLDYLDALEAVNTYSAPDIDWPMPPEVPAK